MVPRQAVRDFPHGERVAKRTGHRADVLSRQAEDAAVFGGDVVVLRRVLLQALGGSEKEGSVPDDGAAKRAAIELAFELGLLGAALPRQRVLRIEALVAEKSVAGATCRAT